MAHKLLSAVFGYEPPPLDFLAELESLKYAITINPYLSYMDFVYIGAFTVLWLIVYPLCNRFIFKPFSEWVLPAEQFMIPVEEDSQESMSSSSSSSVQMRHRTTKETEKKPQQSMRIDHRRRNSAIHKYMTAMWKFSSFSFMFALGAYILFSKAWFLRSFEWWFGWPFQIEPDVQMFYMFDLAYWIQTTLVLFAEPAMKDRAQMVVHHFATIFLIVLSYLWGYYRVGLVIMVLHDASDPFMELAKLFFYIKKQRFADVFFAMFAATFLYTRCYIYPMYVLRSVLYGRMEAVGVLEASQGWWIFNTLLSTLQVLHIFWATLILKILYTQIANKGVQGDIREEDD